jgi:hypothetical protein
VQRDLATIEAYLVPERKLSAAEEERVRALIAASGAQGFAVEIRYRDAIPRSAGGKYEDFVCALA